MVVNSRVVFMLQWPVFFISSINSNSFYQQELQVTEAVSMKALMIQVVSELSVICVQYLFNIYKKIS